MPYSDGRFEIGRSRVPRPSLLEAAQRVIILRGSNAAYHRQGVEIKQRYSSISRLGGQIQINASYVEYADTAIPEQRDDRKAKAYRVGIADGVLIGQPWYGSDLPGLLEAVGALAEQIGSMVEASCPDRQCDDFLTSQTRGQYLMDIGQEGLQEAPELSSILGDVSAQTIFPSYLWQYHQAGIGASLYFLAREYDIACARQLEDALDSIKDGTLDFNTAYEALIQESGS